MGDQDDNKPMKQPLVAGLGRTGLSCARFLARRGVAFAIADSRTTPPGLEELRRELPQVALHLGEFDPALFVQASQVVLSPGIPLDVPAVRAARQARVPILGDIELFARHADAPVVAITGSNGKSTTTTLVGEMAKRAGKDVRVGGNLGTPALDLLGDGRPDLYVLELSSFQLEVTDSLDCLAATVLNISDDHLDRHHSLLEYASVKQRVFRGQGTMVINNDDPLVAAMAEAGRQMVRFGLGLPRAESDYGLARHEQAEWIMRGTEPVMRAEELRIAGRHNLANALAALALGEAAGLPREAMLETLRVFPGLPHRCQFVAELDGVRYYNDSKGTNVGSTLAALAGMPGDKVVLIAGGEGKGQDFSPLQAAVAAHARAVVLIGRDADIIAAALGNAAPMLRADSMADAVQQARGAAQAGDAVLLSPACASFDMFNNYIHRGEVFAAAVRALAP
jgi:UDP-N-acetylmuramoylalanine--D-glutamate ligase